MTRLGQAVHWGRAQTVLWPLTDKLSLVTYARKTFQASDCIWLTPCRVLNVVSLVYASLSAQLKGRHVVDESLMPCLKGTEKMFTDGLKERWYRWATDLKWKSELIHVPKNIPVNTVYFSCCKHGFRWANIVLLLSVFIKGGDEGDFQENGNYFQQPSLDRYNLYRQIW